MQGHKKPGTLVAEIKMKRAQGNCAVLVVEGPDDLAFWSARKVAECEAVVGEGKANVIGCMGRLEGEAIDGVLAVVDADYDVLMEEPTGEPNVLRTDAHDLECMLCRAPALDNVVAEYGSAEKLAAMDVRSELLARALVFGRVRWALLRLGREAGEGVEVPSVEAAWDQMVDRETWKVDGDRLRAEIQTRLGEDAELSVYIDTLPDDADPWHVVHGHDMVKLLRFGLLRVLGSMEVRHGQTDIARALRLAMSKENLRATALGAGIRAWERANGPYVVLG